MKAGYKAERSVTSCSQICSSVRQAQESLSPEQKHWPYGAQFQSVYICETISTLKTGNTILTAKCFLLPCVSLLSLLLSSPPQHWYTFFHCVSVCTLLVVVQLFSHVQLFMTPWTAACQASLSFTISQSLLKPMSIEWVMPSNHLILCRPLLLLPSIFPSIMVFSNQSDLHIR